MSKTKGDVVKDLREMLEDGQINLNEDDQCERKQRKAIDWRT